MRPLLARSLCLLLLLGLSGCAVGYGEMEVSSTTRAPMRSPGNRITVSYFHESLAADGEWFNDPNYGWCWTPYDATSDWQPYRDGHWEYTDYGWSWVSNESWGWATYHYGRWFYDDQYGWAWVPGTEWAPAWVAWRYSDDYCGWAPLPPISSWDASAGLLYSDVNMIPAQNWCFVPRDRVFDVSIRVQVVSVGRNVTLLRRSRDVTRYEIRDGRPVNLGPDIAQVETALGRRVQHVKVVDSDRPERGRGRSGRAGDIGFFRPKVEPLPPQQVPAPEVTRRRAPVPDAAMRQQRGEQQRRLESALAAERARLEREQQNELRGKSQGPDAEEVRRQQAAEKQAFEEHAAKQRQVLEQRMQKKVVKPGRPPREPRPANPNKPDKPEKDKGTG